MTEYTGNARRGRRGAAGVFFRLLWVLLAALSLSGCGSTKVVFTTGLGRDEVFRIGSKVCTTEEFMLYLTNTRNQYENVYGPEVWGVSRDGVTLEDAIKEDVLERIAQVKVMAMLADSKDIGLEAEEEEKVKAAAGEYFDSLTEKEKELLGVSRAVIENLYTEYALADKVYRYIIQDVNPEISDDEARIITLQHILLKTVRVDSEGNRVDMPEEEREEIYARALEIRQQAEEGTDFVELAARYSEAPEITGSFGKGQLDAALDKAAFRLATGKISEVIETDEGYHILKCISTLEREETDANKLVIVEERRREIFEKEYEAFLEPLTRQLNTRLWRKLSFAEGGEVTTCSFFEVYEKYLAGV